MVGMVILAAFVISRIEALAQPFFEITSQAPSNICRRRRSATPSAFRTDAAVVSAAAGPSAGGLCVASAFTRLLSAPHLER